MDSKFRVVVTSLGRQEDGIDERHTGDLKSTGNILFLGWCLFNFLLLFKIHICYIFIMYNLLHN